MTSTTFWRGLVLRMATLACLATASRLPMTAAQEAVTHLPSVPAGSSVRRLTLDEARQLALNNNKALALARLNIEEKQYATVAARKDYFPKVLASDSYFHFDQPLGRLVTTASGQLGLFPPGTVLVNTVVFNQDSNLATVLVAQPITKLIAVNAAVQIARADENTAQAQLDKGTRDLLSGVAQAYHGLLGAQRIQTALELQVKLLEQLVTAKPVPELRVGLVEARQGLVQVRGQVQELTQQLNSLLDLPPCTVLELVDPLPADLPVRCADDVVRFGLANNPEVREAEQSIAKAEAALKVARIDYLPDVNVLGGYANQTGVPSIQQNIGYIGVGANYTLWEWGKRRDVKRQRQTLVAVAHQNLQVTVDKVTLEARKAYITFEQARDALRLAGEMVQARMEAEKVAPGPAVMQAKAETSKAELEAMKAEIAYRVAHAQLAGLIGQQ
jgi:outer membrane protein TolC